MKNENRIWICQIVVIFSVLVFTNSCKKADEKEKLVTDNDTTVADKDGNVYKTVTLGTQIWMAENLKTTRYRNGDKIGTTTPATLDIHLETSPKYQWAYDGNENNVATYGRLYTWYAVTDSRNVCPAGWHIPGKIEWTALTTFLGDESVSGGKLKETGTTHWLSPNSGATNESGYSALPGGGRDSYGGFFDIGRNGGWWSSDDYNANNGWYFYLYNDYSNTNMPSDSKGNGYSVRCLKDN
jgi:uncharacterized protein (TIGR02145 family)